MREYDNDKQLPPHTHTHTGILNTVLECTQHMHVDEGKSFVDIFFFELCVVNAKHTNFPRVVCARLRGFSRIPGNMVLESFSEMMDIVCVYIMYI